MEPQPITPAFVAKWTAVSLGAILALVVLIVVIIMGLNAFGRWQSRADAHNKVSLTHILIQNAQQQAKITKALEANTRAQAQIRYLESVGVKRAQVEIAKTLTPLYIQYEAIKAEMAIANSGRNSTVIYVPAGQGGVPIITPAGAGK